MRRIRFTYAQNDILHVLYVYVLKKSQKSWSPDLLLSRLNLIVPYSLRALLYIGNICI